MSSTILTLEEVAEYLRVSERTVKEWATSGELPGGKLGGSWRFIREDVDSWVAQQLTAHKHALPVTTNHSLHALLDPRRILLIPESMSKAEVLLQMIDKAEDIKGVTSRGELSMAVFAREQLMSTGIGLNIGVPHARLNGVKGVYTVVAISPEGIDDYDALDGLPVRIVILFIVGRNQHTEYIKALAQFSALFKSSIFRERLIAAKETKDVMQLFLDEA